ncbi:lactate/malate family dehydrogenase [Saccharothrix variisporea]|uniref:L-lactate dehydrogenase n=1 Tax=Saccharothrix variisporea TaxID=543527 RepID=A0A495XMJ5_9PSEU|nr:hypothetical protein [Saccharothrix variisporea]RKT74425.1 L-lactate dehydrogenase [Saccharothrix variisporea]
MRIGVFGAAGAVGGAVAAAVVAQGLAGEVVLVDRAADGVACTAMDLGVLAAGSAPVRVRVGTAAELAGCEVVVLTASVPHRDGALRSEFLTANSAVLRELADALSGWRGTLLVVTNPVDVLCLIASRLLPDATVLGYALNDSWRLAEAIGLVTGRAGSRIRAWSLGGHGEHMVPLFDRVLADGVRLELAEGRRAQVLDWIDGWYGRWQRLRTGRTSALATGAGVARVLEALTGTREVVVPVIVRLRGEYGLEDTCLAIPTRLRDGRAVVARWRLTPDDLVALRQAGAAITRMADRAA